ncbi:hypothetical protein AWZ03_005953 [Drosophila navojoa]|uniref:Chitin-binding type-2 domain-containing protein n=1 Tax=Drosophila navojoa TaxID=7232 RepID=A0A484BIM0_DRONA|nr:peritrophin-1 [Drosophila navojoa]TDG47655.1 hypothetical protein AWZ03_005953 [Drosophila navojoa]
MSQCPAYDDPNHIVMFAYPNDCRKYYACVNGLAYLHQCPENLYWSQLTYRCDYRQYAKCENMPYPEQTQYSAYPGDCGRYFETRLLSCPNNYHWNDQYKRCDPPQIAGCRPTPPLSTQIPFEPTAATPPAVIKPTIQPEHNAPIDPQSLCIAAAGQLTYLPYPGDCHKFIQCGPTASVLTCAIGLYWNRSTQSCGSSQIDCQPYELSYFSKEV